MALRAVSKTRTASCVYNVYSNLTKLDIPASSAPTSLFRLISLFRLLSAVSAVSLGIAWIISTLFLGFGLMIKASSSLDPGFLILVGDSNRWASMLYFSLVLLLARAWEGSSASCLVDGAEVVDDDDEGSFERDISIVMVWSKHC